MSKIFDILSKGTGEVADAIRPLVESDPAPAVSPAVEQPGAPAAAQDAPIRAVEFRLPAPSPLLPFEEGQWRPSEQYRILRTKIVQNPSQPHVIVMSSPAPGDGKSVSAINTAGALSLKNEGRVLLLDGDLRKSAVHTLLGLPESPGLADVLRGTCALEDALVRAQEFPNLYILPAGTRVDNPVELLDSAAWKTLCERIRALFRYVIIDSPPVGAVADYDLIQASCDAVILVLRPDHTNRSLCQKALENLPKKKLLGVLLNCVPDWKPGRHAGADYYYYASDKHYSKSKDKG